MLNRKIYTTAAALLCLLFLRHDSFSQTRIEWAEGRNASGYEVEINDQAGRRILLERTDTNHITPDLKPGVYSIRISPLNKFGSVDVRGSWTTLNVQRALDPEINSVSVGAFSAAASSGSFLITGTSLMDGAEVFIVMGESRIKLQSAYERGSLRAAITPSLFSPGWHGLEVINPGGKSARKSDIILISSGPAIESLSQNIFSSNDGRVEIRITGNNIFGKSTAALILNGSEKFKADIETESPETGVFILDTAGMLTGVYDLAAANYLSKPVVLKEALIITDQPRIDSVSRTRFRGDETEVTITIEGEGFIPGAEMILKKRNTETLRRPLAVESRDKASVSFSPAEAGDAGYELIVENPGGHARTYKERILITPAMEKDYRYFFGIAGGYSFILPPWRSILNDSYNGFSLYGGYHLYSFPVNPFVKILGLEAGLSFRTYKNEDKTMISMRELFSIPLTGGVYLLSDYYHPVNIILSGGAGIASTSVELQEDGEINKITSFEGVVYTKLSARYKIYKSLHTEAGISFNNHMYAGSAMREIQPFLMILLAF